MTAAMTLMHHRLPGDAPGPLPPVAITRGPLRRAGRARRNGTPAPIPVNLAPLTLAAHFGYGAVTGALWPLWRRAWGQESGGRVDSGAAFGLAVWGASYLGWVPAMGLLPPVGRHAAGRVGLMLAAHLVWGVALAAADRDLAPQPSGACRTRR
jgi:hypothetical protein